MAFVGLCLRLLSFKLDAATAFDFAAELSDVFQVVLVRIIQETGYRLLLVMVTRLRVKASDNSAVQINVVKGFVIVILIHATFDHIYLDKRVNVKC